MLKYSHQLLIGCCDLTAIISMADTQLNLSYIDQQSAGICMQSTEEDCLLQKCKLTKNKHCIPNYTLYSQSQHNTIQFSNTIQSTSFKFNSRYDGEILELIKMIPFKIIPPNRLKYYHVYPTYYINIFQGNGLRCICFPYGFVQPPQLYYKEGKTLYTLQDMISFIIEPDHSYVICGHSMGGAFSQYFCSLDWGDLEYIKQTSYLITSGTYSIITEIDKQKLIESFQDRMISYCNANDDTIDEFITKYIGDDHAIVEPTMLEGSDLDVHGDEVFQLGSQTFKLSNELHEWQLYRYKLIQKLKLMGGKRRSKKHKNKFKKYSKKIIKKK